MTLIPPSDRGIPEGQRERDSTRRLSLEMLARLAECSPAAMLVADRHRQIAWVNAQTEKMFGYTREELRGRPLELVMPERFRQIYPADSEAYSAEPRLPQIGERLELIGRRKDGTEFPIDIMLSPLETAKESALVLTVIRDVSNPKGVEKALHESEERFRTILDNSPNRREEG